VAVENLLFSTLNEITYIILLSMSVVLQFAEQLICQCIFV